MQQWNVNIGQNSHVVQFDPGKRKKNMRLIVDGAETPIKLSFMQNITGLDHEFTLEGIPCHFVLRGSKADLAVNGTYIDSKKAYTPLRKPGPLTWVFVVLCLAIPVVSLGGALPAVLGVAGAMGCLFVSTAPQLQLPVRVTLCVLITAVAWGLLAVLLFSMAAVAA